MKNTILFFFLLLAAAVSAQSNSFVTDRLRAAEYFRIGTNTSQKVTGFDRVITAPGTHDSLPTSRAVVDFLEANFTPIGYYTAGDGISISDDVITNAAPDQVVGLTGGGIAVSGTYPNFTLTAADQSATNELQTLSIDGSDLTLSNGGGTVTLPGAADGNGIYSGSGVLSGNTLVDLNLNNLTFDNGQISFSTGEGGFFSMSGTTINVNGDGNFEGGTYGFLAEENLFFVGNGNIQVTSGNGLGFQYTTEYPDILTNDRSIPDVGLTKQLISNENGALGTGFTGGGGSGTIPGANVVVSGGDLNIDNQASISISMGDVQGNGQGIGLRLSDITFQFGNPFGAGNYSVISQIDGSENYISIQTPDKEFKFDATSAKFIDFRSTQVGLEYAAEYPDILTNDRSIPDVGLVNLLKQTPVSYTNAAAPNNTIFYSTTDSKLSYKDPAGVVHNLY